MMHSVTLTVCFLYIMVEIGLLDGWMNVLPIRAKVSIFHFKYNFCAHIMLMDVFANLKHTIGLNHHEACIIYHCNVNVRVYY